jgi:hypothetical protein
MGSTSGYVCHGLSMCKRRKGKCASGVFLDSFVDVTVFGRKYTSVAIKYPDCERNS